MKVHLHGVRGSVPTTGPQTERHGGNTSCACAESDGWLVVLDAGTGIKQVETTGCLRHARVDILITHFHIDHIQGLGFFRPLFDPAMEIHIWGPSSHGQSLRSRLNRYLSPPLFPVYFRDLPCRLILHEIGDDTFDIGPFTIRSGFIIHPGPTLGFRVTADGATLAYLPDHEPALGPRGLPDDLRWLSGSELVLDADLLLHDAQYTLEEYPQKIGWGHSAMEHAIAFARMTRVKQLLLTHHDPLRTDAQLDALAQHLTYTQKSGPAFEMSREGMSFSLSS